MDITTSRPELWAEVERLEAKLAESEKARELAGSGEVLARNQPCGCVICACGEVGRCSGCGAKSCTRHASGMPIEDAVWEKHPLLTRAEQAEARCKSRAEQLAGLGLAVEVARKALNDVDAFSRKIYHNANHHEREHDLSKMMDRVLDALRLTSDTSALVAEHRREVLVRAAKQLRLIGQDVSADALERMAEDAGIEGGK